MKSLIWNQQLILKNKKERFGKNDLETGKWEWMEEGQVTRVSKINGFGQTIRLRVIN